MVPTTCIEALLRLAQVITELRCIEVSSTTGVGKVEMGTVAPIEDLHKYYW